MADGAFLAGYAGQSAKELLALCGRYRADSVALAFEAALTEKAARVGLNRLTPAEQTVLAVEALEREVNHDGFIGFFSVGPEHAPRLPESLEAIGRPQVARLARRAIEALGITGPVTEQSIAAAIGEDDEDRDDRLHACDAEYYALAGDLADPLLAFIAAHVDQITVPG